MQKKVIILFGGKSPEHEVSILSARSIIKFINKEQFNISPWLIKKDGYFANKKETENALGEDFKQYVNNDFPYTENILTKKNIKKHSDIIFPILHGPNGEDGKIQGFLDFLNIPYVGNKILGSSIAMDKVISKYIFNSIGLNTADFINFKKVNWKVNKNNIITQINKNIGYPCFVKPANMGSSVGISKVKRCEDLDRSVENAFIYDKKILVEKAINPRELEIAMIGGKNVKTSQVIAEILVDNDGFYDYDAKYKNNNAKLIIPAQIDADTSDTIKKMAIRAFNCFELSGLARIDFLMDRNDGKIYINEINTMPGFTNISMYPKLWEASGIKYSELITKLINLEF